jgi:Ca-activated chloride channel homolog
MKRFFNPILRRFRMVRAVKVPVLFSLLLSLSLCSFAQEGESGTSAEKTLSPYFFIDGGDPSVDNFPLKSTDVSVAINGVIAEVAVKQTYHNGGTLPINGKYVFPASTRAAVHGMTMRIGDRIIRAKIKEREAAKQEFEQAKKEGKSASLLEQQRPNVFSMNVANVMPGDSIEIELNYTEHIVPTDGTYEFVYPTVVGPRYSNTPESSAPESEHWVKSPYLHQGVQPTSSLSINTVVSTGIPIQELACSTHKTMVNWENESLARIDLDSSEKNGGNRDYILRYRLTGEAIESGLMLYKGDTENFFLLTVQPPKRVSSKEIPPREYVFVVDVSGSMNGFPLNVSKQLMKNLIANLKPTDLFNVILFSGSSSAMAPKSVPATQENLSRAIALIDGQNGGGGTELSPALSRAFMLPADDRYSRNIIIATDGYISAEKEAFSLIRNNLDRANVFSFGIGSSVNRFLIEGIAKAGLGEPFVVTNEGEAAGIAEKFRKYISAPVLTDIKVEYKGFDAYDVEPQMIPDLLAERPLVIFGKYRGNASGQIAITGSNGNGSFKKVFDVAGTTPREANHALKFLWARTRIANLGDFAGESEESEAVKEITSLGLAYNLLTKYTSFIAVLEIVRNTNGNAADVDQPLPLPQGVSDLAVGGTNNVPEPGILSMIGILGAMLFIAQWRRQRFFLSKKVDIS